jgi:hypothetical protein
MSMLDADRSRLESAYAVADRFREKAGFRKAAEAAPMTLRLNSLGPGVAMLLIQKPEENARLAEALAIWLLKECAWKQIWLTVAVKADAEHLLKWIQDSDQRQYRAAAHEAQRYLVAIKRFATAICAPEEA